MVKRRGLFLIIASVLMGAGATWGCEIIGSKAG